MPKYILTGMIYASVLVEADDEDDAYQRAKDAWPDGFEVGGGQEVSDIMNMNCAPLRDGESPHDDEEGG